jgi:hypothetical protein
LKRVGAACSDKMTIAGDCPIGMIAGEEQGIFRYRRNTPAQLQKLTDQSGQRLVFPPFPYRTAWQDQEIYIGRIHFLQAKVCHHGEVAHGANGVFRDRKSEDFYRTGTVQSGHCQANFPIGIAVGQEYITGLFACGCCFDGHGLVFI